MLNQPCPCQKTTTTKNNNNEFVQLIQFLEKRTSQTVQPVRKAHFLQSFVSRVCPKTSKLQQYVTSHDVTRVRYETLRQGRRMMAQRQGKRYTLAEDQNSFLLPAMFLIPPLEISPFGLFLLWNVCVISHLHFFFSEIFKTSHIHPIRGV